MKKGELTGIVMAAAMAMFFTKANAQNGIEIKRNVQLETDNDGNALYGDVILCNNNIKKATISRKRPYLCFTDKKGITYIYNTQTLKEMTRTKLNTGVIMITDKGYATGGVNKLFKYEKPEMAYKFSNEPTWACNTLLEAAFAKSWVAICNQEKDVAKMTDGKVIAYDMLTGEELWRKNIPHKLHFPWTEYTDAADKDCIYIIADSLTKLNIRTGETATTVFYGGVNDRTKQIFLSQRILADNNWSQEKVMAVYPQIKKNTTTGTHSNLITDGDKIYIADAKGIYCFTKDLKTVWKTEIPGDMASYSSIYKDSDTIVMQNYGLAFCPMIYGGGITKSGTLFTAAYNAKTGKQIYLNVHDNKLNLINGKITNGRFYWQDTKHIYYNDFGDKQLHELKWGDERITIGRKFNGLPNLLILDKLYTMKDGNLDSICTDRKHIVLMKQDETVYFVDSNGNTKKLESNKVFYKLSNRLYCSMGSAENKNRYLLTDTTGKYVERTITTESDFQTDKYGNIFNLAKDGIGIIRIEK